MIEASVIDALRGRLHGDLLTPGHQDYDMSVATLSDSVTRPFSVNLNAFDSRFLRTCCSRFGSVDMLRAKCGSRCTSKVRCRRSAS